MFRFWKKNREKEIIKIPSDKIIKIELCGENANITFINSDGIEETQNKILDVSYILGIEKLELYVIKEKSMSDIFKLNLPLVKFL
jgi:hypothetical protein